MRSKFLLGSHMKQDQNKITIKIYFKLTMEGFGESTVLEENEDKTLISLLERIDHKNKLNFKNFDFYYFTEHKDNVAEENEDLDNEINFDTQLKFLTVYELDVYIHI